MPGLLAVLLLGPLSQPINTSNRLCQGNFPAAAAQPWLRGTANPQLPRINTCDCYGRAIRPHSAQQSGGCNYDHPIKTDRARSIFRNAGNWLVRFFSPSLNDFPQVSMVHLAGFSRSQL